MAGTGARTWICVPASPHAAKERTMLDVREQQKGGFRAFAARDAERRAAAVAVRSEEMMHGAEGDGTVAGVLAPRTPQAPIGAREAHPTTPLVRGPT